MKLLASQRSPSSLRNQWWLLGIGGLAVLPLAGYWIGDDLLLRWTLPAVAVWLHLWTFAGRRLDRHRVHKGGAILQRLGPGNTLSLLRAWLLAALSGFLLIDAQSGSRAWLPMALYTTSDIADYVDGYLARRSGTASLLGEQLDLELDALGLLIAVSLAVRYGKLGVVFLPIAFARYAYALLIALRTRCRRPVYDLPASLSRRPIAGITMGFVSATLWPIVDRPEATLIGGLVMTAFAASFLRDGAVVAGWIDPSSPLYRQGRAVARRLLLLWLPLGLRIGLALFVFSEVPTLWEPSSALLTGLSALGFHQSLATARVFALLTAVLSTLIVLGIAGRFAAFGLVFPLALTIAAAGLQPRRGAGILLVVALMMLGTGSFSLWQPSDRIFRRRAGEH